jgi:NTP pyrophosphatase (non-canonical NTP hydrolase)
MSNDLSFTDYQLATGETAIYPGAGTGTWPALAYVGLGLGETGEVQGKLKKIVRDHGGITSKEAKTEIGKELGDVLWYVARLADELGLSLEQIAQGNLDKLNSRKERGVLTGSGDNR